MGIPTQRLATSSLWVRRNIVQIDMSWMRRYKGLSTAYMLGLPVPGYWNRRWDRKHRKSTPRAE